MIRLLLGLLLLPVAACNATPDTSTLLVVGSDLENPPFAWVDEEGVARGRDVEMMQLLAERIDRVLLWERMPFDELLDACEAGRVDAVCATLGITEERARRVLFSEPYFETAISVVSRSGADEPTGIDDLADLRVSAGTGTTSQLAVERLLPRARGVFENKSGLPTAERLLRREVDAAVMDGPAARRLVQESGGELRLLVTELTAERYALCLPKGRGALARDLDRALGELRAEGALHALDRRFGLASGTR